MFRFRKRYVKLWQWACHKIIAGHIQYYLDYPDHYNLDLSGIKHQTWRLAYNYFCGGEFSLAWPLLSQLCSEEISYWISTEVVSNYNLTAARCSLEMYFSTRDRLYLHHAYNFYQVGIETMKFDIYAMFRLPLVLHEFGVVMEHYGAFEAAMQTYSKIVTSFPNFRGYFHVMFRTTIVGRYIAEFSDTAKGEQFNGQCIDTLQFLLEALPVGINDIHAVLHYARCLEASSNPANRFRAVGVYQSLHDLCKKKKPEIAEASKFSDFKEWIDEPRTWRLLGDDAHSFEEELLARDCYRVYVEKVQVRRKKSDMEALDIPMLMKMAKNCASIQNYSDAANYALMALKINHYNKEVRQAISLYSPVHAKRIQLEEHSVFVIETLWRSRWMTPGYRKRYHQMIVRELEGKLKVNYWNLRIRRELAYYARAKWRPHFVFENDCAHKIQRQFRSARIIWQWQAPQRAKYSSLASETYRQYMKTPLKRPIREEVYRLSGHKYVSRKHAVNKLVPSMRIQDNAHKVIWKAFKAYKFRQDISKAIVKRIANRIEHNHQASLRIQTVWRMLLARRKRVQLQRERVKLIEETIKIQRFIRKRNQTLRYNVKRLLDHQLRYRTKLEHFLHFSILFLWKKHLQKKEYRARMIVAVNTIQRHYRIWHRQKQWVIYRNRMATRIQTMFRNYRISSLAGVTRRLLISRKAVGFSEMGTELLTSLLHEDPGGGNGISGPSCHYKSPGIRQQSPQFQQVLNQHTIYCNRFFTPSDAVLLGAVLRNPLCRTRRLVLHTVNGTNPSFEFDLLSSITHCRSLRLVALLGGVWTTGFLVKLYQTVQLENPLIQTILVESIHNLKTHELDQLLYASSSLLLDFFNYSVPGIRHLSLHGLSLVGEDMTLLAKGLAVNTSLTHLSVSLNLIEEDGFQIVFKALLSSSKSSLISLDFSWNLVSLTDSLIKLFEAYPPPAPPPPSQRPSASLSSSLPGKTLTINLLHNRITSPYHPPTRESGNNLIVKTVEEPADYDDERIDDYDAGDHRNKRKNTHSPHHRHNQSQSQIHSQSQIRELKQAQRGDGEKNGKQQSKFKSNLLRNINNPLMSKTR